jgi:uncharacterized phage protein gp47/JayE
MNSPITSLGFIAGQNLNPSRFSDAEIQSAERLVSQFLLDTFPTMDFAKGSALYDVVVRPTAMIYLISRLEWESLRATQSLKGVIENPEVASAEVVDAILSNFQIKRRVGSSAKGLVRMVFSRNVSQAIQSSVVFRTAEGLEFRPTGSFRLISDVVDQGDIKLQSSGASQFVAIVPVQAVARGSRFQISDGTPLSVSLQSSAFVAASAFGNFSGGGDDETNEDLIARLPEAMSVKNLASRLSISATIKDRFPGVFDVSVQGSFDPAMTRNSHNAFGMKTGGFADIYVKMMSGISTKTVEVVATRVELDTVEKSATYSVFVDREIAPGHYFVRSVKQDAASISSLSIVSQIRGVDVSPGAENQYPNRIPRLVEGAFSRYQTLDTIFKIDYDEDLGSTIEDQLPESINVLADIVFAEGIKEIQGYVSSRDSGMILADYLVRAAIPCFVRLPIIKIKAVSDTSAESVRLAIYEYINKLPMGASLKIDEMVVRIRSVSGVRSVELPITVSGEILCPSGDVLDIRSNGDLSIPYRPEIMVVPQNTTFFIELAEIDIEVTIA